MMDEKTILVKDLLRKQEQEEFFTKWQLEGSDILEEFTTSFGWSILVNKEKGTGRIFINASPIVENPIINKEGALALTQNLLALVNKNTFLSNLHMGEIEGRNGIMLCHTISILDDLAENFDHYGIENVSALSKLLRFSENMSFISLTRGREGVTLNYLKTVQKVLEQNIISENDKKGLFKR